MTRPADRAVVAGTVLCAVIAGCMPAPTVLQRSVDGVPYTLHLDDDRHKCGVRGIRAGCTQWDSRGAHVYMSSLAPEYVLPHEEAHVKGMRHGVWDINWVAEPGRQVMTICSTILQAPTGKWATRYPMGAQLCITPRGETVTPNNLGNRPPLFGAASAGAQGSATDYWEGKREMNDLITLHEPQWDCDCGDCARYERNRLRVALLETARRVEALKRPCGMDPETPQAIRNGEYMSIALIARAALMGPNV